MKNYDRILAGMSDDMGGYENKDLLEIGSDSEGALLKELSALCASATGINPVMPSRRVAENSYLLTADVTDAPFPDESFDGVLSVATFEHVRNLDTALSEIWRVLRPGGRLVAQFGPVWSCMWGHHLWVVSRKLDIRFTYNTPPVLSPFCHLLKDRAALVEECAAVHGPDHAARIATFVARSPEQNRLMLADYERIIAASPFGETRLKTHRNLRLEEMYLDGAAFDDVVAPVIEKHGPGDYLTAVCTLVAVK